MMAFYPNYTDNSKSEYIKLYTLRLYSLLDASYSGVLNIWDLRPDDLRWLDVTIIEIK